MKTATSIMAAALLALTPAALPAQNTAGTADTGYTTTTTEREEDRDFPWGLLGLLGLAGLLGRKKNERDIHVDARRDNTRT